MIDLQNESILSLSEAAKALPRVEGKRPHTSTIFRWTRDGVRGVRLDSVRLGRRLCTSREALQRFVTALSEAPPLERKPQPRNPRGRTDKQRAHDMAQARKRLAANGITGGAL